jgi:hypothetical protein
MKNGIDESRERLNADLYNHIMNSDYNNVVKALNQGADPSEIFNGCSMIRAAVTLKNTAITACLLRYNALIEHDPELQQHHIINDYTFDNNFDDTDNSCIKIFKVALLTDSISIHDIINKQAIPENLYSLFLARIVISVENKIKASGIDAGINLIDTFKDYYSSLGVELAGELKLISTQMTDIAMIVDRMLKKDSIHVPKYLEHSNLLHDFFLSLIKFSVVEKVKVDGVNAGINLIDTFKDYYSSLGIELSDKLELTSKEMVGMVYAVYDIFHNHQINVNMNIPNNLHSFFLAQVQLYVEKVIKLDGDINTCANLIKEFVQNYSNLNPNLVEALELYLSGTEIYPAYLNLAVNGAVFQLTENDI